MWSTTPQRLSAFVGELAKMGIPPTSVRNLQNIFKEYRVYPARDFPQFCTPEPPDAFFSYHSAQDFVDVQEIVWRAFDFAAERLLRKRPNLMQEDLEPMISDGVRLWIDFMFIDQSARDLREELEVLPRLLQTASTHFVLGGQSLLRSWCCYEIALFNQHFAEADGHRLASLDRPGLRSYIAPTRNLYIGWEQTETSEVEDKSFIAERISGAFPGGFDGFHHIMAQANSVAVLPLAEGTTWSTPAADDNLDEAVERWYRRSFPEGALL
jgi:hypothetical protein